MRVLVVGAGSIGARHLRNLRHAGVGDLSVADPSPERRALAEREAGARAHASLAEGLAAKPDVVVVATPTHLHLPVALEAARAGCDLFIEKPLAHAEEGLDELARVVEQNRAVAMVACNLRFHHGPATLKRLLDEGRLGKVYSASFDVGYHLPDWVPGRDYRATYSARRELGGGVALDAIHEVDYAQWLLGDVAEAVALGGKVSDLDIDVEDCVDAVLRFRAGPTALLHMDYLQRAYARTAKLVGSEGTAVWDVATGVRWYDAATRVWTHDPTPPGEADAMYVREMSHFLACVGARRPPMSGLAEARRALRVCLGLRASIASGGRWAP